MRTSEIMTISLPSQLAIASANGAKRHSMTRSEFMRAALRYYLEYQNLGEAVATAHAERKSGKLRTLPKGGLATLIRNR